MISGTRSRYVAPSAVYSIRVLKRLLSGTSLLRQEITLIDLLSLIIYPTKQSLVKPYLNNYLVKEMMERDELSATNTASNIPLDVLHDSSHLALLEACIHTGVDARGNRLSYRERQILIKTKNFLMEKLAEKYTQGDMEALFNVLASQSNEK